MISFYVKKSTTSIGDASKKRIGEILLNFPEGFNHQVLVPADVDCVRRTPEGDESPGMPLVMGDDDNPLWLDSTQSDRLRISLLTGDSEPVSGLEKLGEYIRARELQCEPITPTFGYTKETHAV